MFTYSLILIFTPDLPPPEFIAAAVSPSQLAGAPAGIDRRQPKK